MRAPHDIGGLPGGPVDTDPCAATFWEKQIDAINVLLSDKKRRIISGDERRLAIESLGEEVYRTLGYYERWTAAAARLLLQKGILSQDEIDAKIAEIRARIGEEQEKTDG
ncbi:MAG: nitrile hydratase subunit beta [Proteobacteria bacterium]|nr:nitrile hydratase subunit beta [Pseudomonadota bacterium]